MGSEQIFVRYISANDVIFVRENISSRTTDNQLPATVHYSLPTTHYSLLTT
ncbi:MAG: hypothetical protein LBG72_07500 [Spirochaetaceae bacterium]|nr:hypothetical protein [Spirochaetaceae bacterium]